MNQKHVVIAVLVSTCLPLTVMAQSNNQREQQQYERQRQQQQQQRQKSNNNQVNRAQEQKRYQATRPSTPARSYTPPQRSNSSSYNNKRR